MGWEFRFFKVISQNEYEKIVKEWERKNVYPERRSDCYIIVDNDKGVKIRNYNSGRERVEIKICQKRSQGIENWSKTFSKRVGKSVASSIELLKKRKGYFENNMKVMINIVSKIRTSFSGFSEVTLLKCTGYVFDVEKDSIDKETENIFFGITKSIEGYSLSSIKSRVDDVKQKGENGEEPMDYICGYPEFLKSVQEKE